MAEVLRKTRGTCPVCVKMVPAEVLEDENHIYIEKNCPEHGLNRALLAIDAAYYKELEDYFFSLHTESSPQRDYILRLTGRCNMNCPICLASANEFPEEDLTQQKIEELTGSGRRLKLDLMGAEPTLRTDSKPIRPPINSIRFRLRASPNPAREFPG